MRERERERGERERIKGCVCLCVYGVEVSGHLCLRVRLCACVSPQYANVGILLSTACGSPRRHRAPFAPEGKFVCKNPAAFAGRKEEDRASKERDR